MNFQKISCSEHLEPIECINPRRDRWAFRWNHHKEDGGWFAFEAVADHRPSVDEIREVIDAQIDAATQSDIIEGFEWNGKKIRLTDTAQRNFLFAVYSLNHTGEIDRAPFVGLLEADTDAAAADELGDMVAAAHQGTPRAGQTGEGGGGLLRLRIIAYHRRQRHRRPGYLSLCGRKSSSC